MPASFSRAGMHAPEGSEPDTQPPAKMLWSDKWQQWCHDEAQGARAKHVPKELRRVYARETSLRQFYNDCGARWTPVGREGRKASTFGKDRQALNRWERFTPRPADWPDDQHWPGPSLEFLETVDDEWLSAVWKQMRKSGLKPATVRTTRGQVLTIIRHAVKVRAIRRCPAGAFAEKHEATTRIYTPAEVVVGMRALSVEPILQAAFWLALHVGPRSEDLFLLKWSDFRWDHLGRRVVEFTAIKTGKTQCIPIADCVWDVLDQLDRESPYVFAGLGNPKAKSPEKSAEARMRNLFTKRLMKRAGIVFPDKPWQVCRATCNERFESHKPGVGKFVLGHALQDVNTQSYRQPSELIHAAVATLPPYTLEARPADVPPAATLSHLQEARKMLTATKKRKTSDAPEAGGFDYGVLKNAKLRQLVQEQTAEIRGLVARNAANVVEIGQRLIEVQNMLGISMREWCRVEFEWSQAQASNYMRAAKEFGELDCLDRFQPTALFALARNAVPEAAVKAAVADARNGRFITRHRALELIESHGGTPARSDAGKPRGGVATSPRTAAGPANPLAAIRETLEGLRAHLSDIAADQREELADQFLQLAMDLRSLKRKTA